MPQVNITLDGRGGQRMNEATRGNIGRSMAILFKETRTRTRHVEIDGETVVRQIPYETQRLISVATIQAALGNRFRITGLSQREASDLALLLRAGALAAPMYIVEERTVGASLGEDNIRAGMLSVAVGFGLVLLFMVAYYKFFGLAANVALAANLVLLTAVMSLLGATLTLPGIAGIVLTVGMAVDANVLIFSRIREELANRSPQQAIHAGFDRAFITIFDANLTTFLVAIVLYAIGSGPVKGFAVTLAIGIVTSMFTAIVLTRALINALYGGPPRCAAGDLGAIMADPTPASRRRSGESPAQVFLGDKAGLRFHALAPAHLDVVDPTYRCIPDASGGEGLELWPRLHRRNPGRGELSEAADPQTVRLGLEAQGYGDLVVQNFGTARDVLVRVPPDVVGETATVGDVILAALRADYGDQVALRRSEFVGPAVGEELREQGGWPCSLPCPW